MKISTENATLENLGIKDFDLTKDFDISTIDNAIKMVEEARSNNGASYNALSYVVSNNQYTGLNLTSSLSRMKDLDYGVAVSEMKKEEILQNYKYFIQKKENGNALIKQNLMF